MANARDFDGTAMSAAHIGPALADMYGAMKNASPTLAKGTALMQVVDGTPDLSGNVDITGNLTVATGATVTAGGVTITAGGLAVTAGNIGFHGATPVVKHATTGNVTGFVAGSGTASKSDSVYAGAAGSTAYTVGDLVTALKALGLLTA